MIWLIDVTTYAKEIANELQEIRNDFFRMKKHVRHVVLGEHVEPKMRTYSYGLLRIATILSFNGIETEYLHYYDVDQKVELSEVAPELIAFSIVCPTVGMADSIMRKLRPIYPKARFAIGGPHINVACKQTISRYPDFDIYCNRNDVEAATMLARQSLASPQGDYVDFSLLPYTLKEYQINTVTTLGCSFTCKYCQDNRIRYGEISKSGHLAYLVHHLEPRTCIHFFDSVLGGTAQRLINVCDCIQKVEHDFILSCDIRAEMIDKRTIEALVRSGFHEVRMGIETIDSMVLETNSRTLGKSPFLAAVQMLRNYSDIYVTVYSVIGLPGSTQQSCDDTAHFFSELLDSRAVDEIKNCMYVPYPIDDVQYNSIRIKTDNWNEYDRQSYPVYELPHMKSEEIWNAYLVSRKYYCLHKTRNCGILKEKGGIPKCRGRSTK